jgi:hypothetical protein
MAGIDEIGRLIEALSCLRNNINTTAKQTWYVEKTHGGANYQGTREHPFNTIAAAINAAAAGDTIRIAEGTGSYDEAVSIPAGLTGLRVICEPGVYLINTTPGTVVAIAAALVYWEGGTIETNGQTGMEVNGEFFTGKDIRVYNSNIGFDMNAAHPLLINCRTNETAASGFDISEDSGYYVNCACHGAAASRGFYLSHTNAHNNIFVRCATLGCTAGGYETVAGADENLFDHCSQSILCAGPTDGGASNTWANHNQDSQIAAGNTLQEDLAAIEALIAATAIGKAQIAATTIDLNQAAGTYDLFTGTAQDVIVEGLVIRMPNIVAGGALTSISIQTDDATPVVFVTAAEGAVANLTAEAQLSWAPASGIALIKVGTKIRLTIGGGAHGVAYVCDVIAVCRAVVDGGYLA